MPSYQFTINGRLVYGGEEFLSLSMAIIKVLTPAGDTNAYRAGTVVTLVALPRNPGYEPIWKGVDSHSGYTATLRMDVVKSVEFLIGARLATPTSAPTPTRGGDHRRSAPHGGAHRNADAHANPHAPASGGTDAYADAYTNGDADSYTYAATSGRAHLI